MDERYDFQAASPMAVTFILRNYMPHLPAGQHVDYMFQTKTTKVWNNLPIRPANSTKPKTCSGKRRGPPEELYDLQTPTPTR